MMSDALLDKVFCGDCLELMDRLPDACVDAIITDPPYGRKSLPLYEGLLKRAGRLLKPAGHLLVIAPHYAYPEIFSFDAPGLRYRWALTMIQRKGPWPRLCNAQKTIAVTQKPILWWTKHPWGGRDFSVVEDSFENPAPEKDAHEWQQAERWADYCLQWCPEGGVVLDPFLGSGTMAVVCAREGRYCIGMESNPETCERAEARIAIARSEFQAQMDI